MNWFQRLFQKPVAANPKPKAPATGETASRESLRTRFASRYRPAVQLRPTTTAGFSRLGGLPLMPDGLEWPRWNGKPQSFLAQLDLREINAALPSFLPATGFLYFFYDQEQSAWGSDPKDLGGWRVYYCEGEPATFTERAAPPGLPDKYIYQAKTVAPQSIDVLPDCETLSSAEFEWDRDSDAYLKLQSEAFAGHHSHQVLGYPSPVQNADMEIECQLASHGVYVGDPAGYKDPRAADLKAGAAEWKLLLQLDTDNDTGWMWGDVGTLYFWVRESDAKRGDFSKVWMIFQCC